MAFPAIAAENTSSNASGTSHNVALPAGIVAGNLLVAIFGGNAVATLTWPTGWTQFVTGGTAGTLAAAYKFALGNEGASITVTSGATSLSSATHSYRITGSGEPPRAGSNVTVANSATGNPPSLTSTFGVIDTLWIACSFANTQSDVTTFPTSYTNTLEFANGSICLATCNRNNAVATEDPGAFTWAGTGRKNSNTIAIKAGLPIIGEVGALSLGGFAPTYFIATNTQITPDTGSLSLSSLESQTHWGVVPSTGSLNATGVAPTVTLPSIKGDWAGSRLSPAKLPARRYGSFADKTRIAFTPAFGELDASGFIPGVIVGVVENFTFIPPAGTLTFSSSASTVIVNRRITPTLASLAAGVFTPAVIQDYPIRAPPGDLTLTGAAATQGITFIPPVGSLTATGAAPTTGTGVALFPSSGDLTLSGFAPNAGQSYFLTPSVGTLTATGAAPTIRTGIVPTVGALTLSGQAPTLAISVFKPRITQLGPSVLPAQRYRSFSGKNVQHVTKITQLSPAAIPARRYGSFGFKAGGAVNAQITPPIATTAFTGFAPLVSQSYTITIPGPSGAVAVLYLVDENGHYVVDENGNYVVVEQQVAVTAIFNGFVPQVTVSDLGQEISFTPPTGTLSLTSSAPVSGIEVTPSTGTLTLTGAIPSVATSTVITPPVGDLTATGDAPSAGATMTPDAGTLTLSGDVPGIYQGQVILPDTGTLTLTGYALSISDIPITPDTGSLALTGSAPAVGFSTSIVPDVGNLTVTGAAPTTAEAIFITVPSGSLDLSGNVPATNLGIIVPPAGDLTLTGFAPSLGGAHTRSNVYGYISHVRRRPNKC